MYLDQMINELLKVNHFKAEIPKDQSEKEKILNYLRTITLSEDLSETYYELEKDYLNSKPKDIIYVEDIKDKLIDGIYIYKGDITRIKADAIVNAANEKMLGCFIPGHACIDNAIHMSAGMKLRHACYEIMKEQGYDEPVGHAKITEAYELPSSYVIHTVGPNMNGSETMTLEKAKEALKKCYISILDQAAENRIKNLVFCSISTGVYGLPIKVGAKVALETISKYLKNNKETFEKIIIDVFSEEDYEIYKNQADRF